jgi:hypothetical protein
MMKPSPPKNPRPSFLENSIPTDTPLAAKKGAFLTDEFSLKFG